MSPARGTSTFDDCQLNQKLPFLVFCCQRSGHVQNLIRQAKKIDRFCHLSLQTRCTPSQPHLPPLIVHPPLLSAIVSGRREPCAGL